MYSDMKKYIFLFLVSLFMVSCNRDMEFETISITEPALEVIVEGVPVDNTYPKVEGATVQLFKEDGSFLVEATTDNSGRVLFTKEQLKEKGIFVVKAMKGAQSGEEKTPYLLLNDGVTLLIITIE